MQCTYPELFPLSTKGALRLGALEIGEVDQWGGMESREVDRNLRIVHCFTVQFSIAPGREAPLCEPLIYCSITSSLTRSEGQNGLARI